MLRHADNRKWYAIVMKVSRRKFGFDNDEVIDVVNLKLPTEMFGSFGAADGVYPAYHMNKLHWISVLLPDAPDDVVQFLVNVSFEATKTKTRAGQKKKHPCGCFFIGGGCGIRTHVPFGLTVFKKSTKEYRFSSVRCSSG